MRRVLGTFRTREDEVILRFGPIGLVRGGGSRRHVADRRAATERRVARAMNPDPILQLLAIEAPWPSTG
jgi:hypothetical protein